MNRREFLKGAAALSVWMVSPKRSIAEEPRTAPSVEVLPARQENIVEHHEDVYFYGGTPCASSYFYVECVPGRFSFCDTCRERTGQNL